GVAVGFGGKFLLLQFGIRRHAPLAIAARELEHAEIERMESGEGDELEFVTHRAKFALEFRDRRIVEFRFPVEGGRTVVGEWFAGEFFAKLFSELLCFTDIRRGSFKPKQVGIGRVTECARDRLVDPSANAEETFYRSLA